MNFPSNLKYTKDHEWIKVEGGVGTVGITEYAQGELGDVVFVELPAVGTTLSQGKAFGTIEAVKAVSDLYAPLSGTVTEVNKKVQDTPGGSEQGAVRRRLDDQSEADEGR